MGNCYATHKEMRRVSLNCSGVRQTKAWAVFFRFAIGMINYSIVLKLPVDAGDMRTVIVVLLAFLYDFSTIQKDHKRFSGKVINFCLLAPSFLLSLYIFLGFVEPIFGGSQFPIVVQHGRYFINTLSFKVPYNVVVDGTLIFAMGSLLESILLFLHDKGLLLPKSDDDGKKSETPPSDGAQATSNTPRRVVKRIPIARGHAAAEEGKS